MRSLSNRGSTVLSARSSAITRLRAGNVDPFFSAVPSSGLLNPFWDKALIVNCCGLIGYRLKSPDRRKESRRMDN